MNTETLATLVGSLNAESDRLNLEPLTSDQIECLGDAERIDEAIGMLDDFEARCGMNTVRARLLLLALKAHNLADNDDTWDSEECEAADTDFWTLAHANMTQEQREKLDDLCVKATLAECIEHGLTILGLELPASTELDAQSTQTIGKLP